MPVLGEGRPALMRDPLLIDARALSTSVCRPISWHWRTRAVKRDRVSYQQIDRPPHG
jgi:hypothetical protein